jgi:membrane protein implicated in regulation of membrane protease activity
MAWWMWLLLGFVLLAVELSTPGGFFFLFFAAGAIVVGLLALAGLATGVWLEWLLFSVLSVAALLLFRKPLLAYIRQKEPSPEVDTLVGEVAVALSDMEIDAVGKAELRGAAWNARNIGAAPLAAGQRCTVESVTGLTLLIKG